MRRSPAQILVALAVSGSALAAIVVFAVTDANAEAEQAQLEQLEQLQQAARVRAAELEARTAAEAEAAAAAELEVLGPPVPPEFVALHVIGGMELDRVLEGFERDGLALQATVDGEPLDPDDYDRHRVALLAEVPEFVAPGATVVLEAEPKPEPKRKFSKKYGRGY